MLVTDSDDEAAAVEEGVLQGVGTRDSDARSVDDPADETRDATSSSDSPSIRAVERPMHAVPRRVRRGPAIGPRTRDALARQLYLQCVLPVWHSALRTAHVA